MKLKILLSAISFVAACTIAANAAPAARWLETTHDFGAFDEDMGNVDALFRVVNDGDAPLVILAARASCGCTVPAFTSDGIAPGDTATIKVTYNPAGRPGKFNKKVKVETNCEPSQSILTIKGVVIGASNTLRARFPIEVGPLKLRNSSLPMGEISKGRVKTGFLEGYNQSPDTIHPSVSGLPEFIKVDIAPRAVPPGEQTTFTFFYDTSRDNDWGLVSHEATFFPDTDITEGKTVDIMAIIKEDFSKLSKEQLEKAPRIALSETSVDLGDINRDDTYEREILIDNFGKDQLIIRKVSTPDPSVSVRINKDKIKGGAQGRMTIKVVPSPSSDNDILNSRITIITNDPDRPTSIVRVTGEYK
ncbi:MAG TPA: DUF1573 domain-containing protein [Muribaculum sp.]|jgi:hypothetical protein|uniref:DUF1573 domain-containing protein n=1 Tax=Heminiphilus faecis TaxID=2601703 RepID=A0ABV4CRL1_9BACT|nr:DUF1573 domain-containing protein [Heminiphilus faecis]RLT77980.1 DUF1573 domain-containing protein [bacterium J10(2018)]HRF69271.1 DUF1573 domain-containing protein [Muribaculum sp.]